MMRSYFRNNFLLLAAIVCFALPRESSAIDSGDPAITDVQEFTVDGISVLLRESKEAPTVTAIMYINGGTSVMSENELASSEYFAMKLIPESGTELTSK